MAKQHYVACVECGRTFDASRGGYYNKRTRRYTCPKCGKALKKEYKASAKEQAADQRERETGMRQSVGAMIAKVAAGALFLIVAFTMKSVGELLTGFVIAASLIAWGIVPYFMAKKKQEEARRKSARKKKVCPYCGAVTRGSVCEYCGSDLEADEE